MSKIYFSNKRVPERSIWEHRRSQDFVWGALFSSKSRRPFF